MSVFQGFSNIGKVPELRQRALRRRVAIYGRGVITTRRSARHA